MDRNRFRVLNEGIVLDRLSGIKWMVDVYGMGGEYSHGAAMEFGEGIDVYGVRGWRMPSVDELVMIVDYGRVRPASPVDTLQQSLFNFSNNLILWTSTEVVNSSMMAWSINFNSGQVVESMKSCTHAVRLCCDNW